MNWVEHEGLAHFESIDRYLLRAGCGWLRPELLKLYCSTNRCTLRTSGFWARATHNLGLRTGWVRYWAGKPITLQANSEKQAQGMKFQRIFSSRFPIWQANKKATIRDPGTHRRSLRNASAEAELATLRPRVPPK